jgi:hypothetical protein
MLHTTYLPSKVDYVCHRVQSNKSVLQQLGSACLHVPIPSRKKILHAPTCYPEVALHITTLDLSTQPHFRLGPHYIKLHVIVQYHYLGPIVLSRNISPVSARISVLTSARRSAETNRRNLTHSPARQQRRCTVRLFPHTSIIIIGHPRTRLWQSPSSAQLSRC